MKKFRRKGEAATLKKEAREALTERTQSGRSEGKRERGRVSEGRRLQVPLAEFITVGRLCLLPELISSSLK